MKFYNFYAGPYTISVFDNNGNTVDAKVSHFNTEDVSMTQGPIFIHVTSVVAMNGYDSSYHRELNEYFMINGSVNSSTKIIFVYDPKLNSSLDNAISNGGNDYKVLTAIDSGFMLPIKDAAAMANINKTDNPSFYADGVYIMPVRIPFVADKYQRVGVSYNLTNASSIPVSATTESILTIDTPYYSNGFSSTANNFQMINATNVEVDANVTLPPSSYYQSRNNQCNSITVNGKSSNSVMFNYGPSNGYEPPCWNQAPKYPMITIYAAPNTPISDFMGFYPAQLSSQNFQLYINGNWYVVNGNSPGMREYCNNPYSTVRVILVPGTGGTNPIQKNIRPVEYYISDPQSGTLSLSDIPLPQNPPDTTPDNGKTSSNNNLLVVFFIVLILIIIMIIGIAYIYFSKDPNNS